MLATSLRRGLAAGLVAGLLAGLFALVVGHDPMAEAIRLEEQAHHGHADDPTAADHDHDEGHGHAQDGGHGHGEHGHAHDHDDGQGHAHEHEHLFSRTTQQVMLPVGTAVIGAALGGLFGLVFAFARARMRDPSEWRASLKLGGAAWAVTVLAPTLTFPANPEGVGDAGAIGSRTSGYLATIAVAFVLAVVAWAWAGWLRRNTSLRAATRQTVVAASVLLAAAVALVLMPSDLPGDGFPAEVLWRFRLASLGTQTLLWVGIAAGFGLLWDRDRAAPAAAGVTGHSEVAS